MHFRQENFVPTLSTFSTAALGFLSINPVFFTSKTISGSTLDNNFGFDPLFDVESGAHKI